MAVTVGGTSITFNDGTTQTTAAATPTFGAIGTYCFPASGGGTLALGATVAGSTFNYYDSSSALVSMGLSGTWRMMGGQSNDGTARRIFIRLS